MAVPRASVLAEALPPKAVGPLVVAATLLALSGGVAAEADSLNDAFGPREVALGESMRGSAQGALSITLNPAGLALDRQLVFEGSYGYRGRDGASSVSVSACDSTVVVPGCFYYRYFGAEPTIEGVSTPRRSHELGSTWARALTSQLLVGTNLRWFDYNSELADEDDASGFAFDAGVTFRATDAVSAGVVGYNLFAADSAQYPMGLGSGLAVRPSPNLGLSFDAVWNLERDDGNGQARYGGGVELFLRSSDIQSGYPIRLGGVYDTFSDAGYLTGGLGFSSIKLGLDVSARRQVSGGDELTILAGLRLFGPTAP